MSQALNRIGKSLLKYFKPIRMASPHHEGDNQSSKKGFRLFSVKKPAAEEPRSAQAASAVAEEQLLSETAPLPEKPPVHWLELVVYLLGACRKVTDKVRRKSGILTYQAAAQQRSKGKFKSIGTIVDTTPIYAENQDGPKKNAA